MEMIVGVGVPLLLLGGYDFWAMYRGKISSQYQKYIASEDEKTVEEKLKEQVSETSGEQNRYGLRVLSMALGFTGLLILLISFIAGKANILVGGVGLVIIGIAYWILRIANKTFNIEEKEKEKVIDSR